MAEASLIVGRYYGPSRRARGCYWPLEEGQGLLLVASVSRARSSGPQGLPLTTLKQSLLPGSLQPSQGHLGQFQAICALSPNS